MQKKQNPEPDDKEQSQRFVETAKKLETDESGESFQNVIGKIAKKSSQRLSSDSCNKPKSRTL